MSRRSRYLAELLCVWSLSFSVPAFAQEDPAAAIAELRAENARLAAKIDALEAALKQRGAVQAEPTKAPASVAGVTTQALPPPAIVAAVQPAPPPSRTVTVSVPPAPADRPVQGFGIGLQLTGSSSGGQVAITVGQSLRATSVDPDQVDASGVSWSLTASAPVAKSGDTAIGTLDSFTDSSSLKLRVGKLFMTMPNLLTDPAYRGLMKAATDECIKKAKDNAGKIACMETDVDEGFIKTWVPDRIDEYIRLTTAQRFAWGFGAEASIGYRKFDYINALAAKDSVDRVPWGVKGYLTVLPDPTLAFVASLAYQRGFDEQKSAAICPTATGTRTSCPVGADGLPARKDKLLIAFEGRKLFDLSRSGLQNGVIDRFGIAPQATYDAKNDDFGLDVPVYLTVDDKGALIGGIRFGYKTGDDGFNAGVFVGGAFDLFKR